MHPETLQDSDFEALKFKLLLPTFEVLGLLDALYAFAATQAIEGNLEPFDEETICAWIEYEEDPYELFAALRECNWIDEVLSGIYLKERKGDSFRPKMKRTPAKRNKYTYSESFQRFWKIYPRREDKRRAWDKWQMALKLLMEAEDMPLENAEDLIIVKADEYRLNREGKPKEYIKQPATWLHAGGYESEYEKPTNGELDNVDLWINGA